MPKKITITLLATVVIVFVVLGAIQVMAQDTTDWNCIVTGDESADALPTRWNVAVDTIFPVLEQQPNGGVTDWITRYDWVLTPQAHRKTKALSHLTIGMPVEIDHGCGTLPTSIGSCLNLEILIDDSTTFTYPVTVDTSDNSCNVTDPGYYYIKIDNLDILRQVTVSLRITSADKLGVKNNWYVVKSADCGIVHVQGPAVCEEPPETPAIQSTQNTFTWTDPDGNQNSGRVTRYVQDGENIYVVEVCYKAIQSCIETDWEEVTGYELSSFRFGIPVATCSGPWCWHDPSGQAYEIHIVTDATDLGSLVGNQWSCPWFINPPGLWINPCAW
jgi:hypothetical protein